MTFQNLTRLGMLANLLIRSPVIMTHSVRCSPRLLRPVLHRTGVLGVRLVGGNAVGIFIHSIEPGSPACDVGLQRGDQVGITLVNSPTI